MIVSVPTGSALVVIVATPFVNCTVGPGAPFTVDVISPVGTPLPDTGVTVAAKVTGDPALCGFALDVNVVVVAIVVAPRSSLATKPVNFVIALFVVWNASVVTGKSVDV